MPLFNEAGEPLPKLNLKPSEEKRLKILSNLRYPEDEERIFHLRPSDFRIWLYLLNPREALLLTSTNGISNRVIQQMNPPIVKLAADFIWRILN